MKIFNLIFCLLFIIAAVLQYNDPDPYLWIPIYLYAAILCGLAAGQKYYPKLYLAGIVAFSAYAVYLLFTDEGMLDWISEHDAGNIAQSMKATKPWIENTREFFGLAIIITVLTVNYIDAKRKMRATRY